MYDVVWSFWEDRSYLCPRIPLTPKPCLSYLRTAAPATSLNWSIWLATPCYKIGGIWTHLFTQSSAPLSLGSHPVPRVSQGVGLGGNISPNIEGPWWHKGGHSADWMSGFLLSWMCEFLKFIYLFIRLFIFIFWPSRVACGILVPGPGIEPAPPVLEARGLNQWASRKVWMCEFFFF